MRYLLIVLLLIASSLQAESIDVPGGKLWYEARGEGPPLVLLHDGLVPSGTWDGQMPAFARLFRTVRYDRRGYGRSDAAKEAFSDLDDLHAVRGVARHQHDQGRARRRAHSRHLVQSHPGVPGSSAQEEEGLRGQQGRPPGAEGGLRPLPCSFSGG